MDGIAGTYFCERESFDEKFLDDADGFTGRAQGIAPGLKVLSRRQREIVRLASEGLLNKQIAWQLGITVATVKAHMSLAIERLSAKNRTHAVAIYVRETLTH